MYNWNIRKWNYLMFGIMGEGKVSGGIDEIGLGKYWLMLKLGNIYMGFIIFFCLFSYVWNCS